MIRITHPLAGMIATLTIAIFWFSTVLAELFGTYSTIVLVKTMIPWDMYTNNLLAEHHIRYGQYGGIGYYHVSDQYIALFSNFIPCGVYEATYIFDGVLDNESDIQPKTIHGDTGAQSEVVFAFAYLLAIKLMPRIRNFKHLKYYRPIAPAGVSFEHIDTMFTNDNIDWSLIEAHYYDMLRVVMSIQCGKIKASTILRKLSTQSRKKQDLPSFPRAGSCDSNNIYAQLYQ